MHCKQVLEAFAVVVMEVCVCPANRLSSTAVDLQGKNNNKKEEWEKYGGGGEVMVVVIILESEFIG